MIAKKPKSKRTIPIALSLLLLLLLPGCFVEQFPQATEAEDQGKNPVQGLQSINCNILIVGGGIGGVHTAYQLAKRGKESVCLFELENRLGGRIYVPNLMSNSPSVPIMPSGLTKLNTWGANQDAHDDFKDHDNYSDAGGY